MYSRNAARNTRVRLKGEFTVRLLDGDVELYCCKRSNLITSGGENLFAQRLLSLLSVNPPRYLALGTGITVAAKTDIALGTEFAGARADIAGDSSVVVNQLRLHYLFSPPITYTNASEIGVFNAATVGVMVSRSILAPFTAEVTQTLDILWALTFVGAD